MTNLLCVWCLTVYLDENGHDYAQCVETCKERLNFYIKQVEEAQGALVRAQGELVATPERMLPPLKDSLVVTTCRTCELTYVKGEDHILENCAQVLQERLKTIEQQAIRDRAALRRTEDLLSLQRMMRGDGRGAQ